MTVCFTLCSRNYLAHAKVLARSFTAHHPEGRFVVGLVDQLQTEDASLVQDVECLPVDDLLEPLIEDMKARYNIIELNTAVKPFYIDYFFRRGADRVIYLDPDTRLFERLDHVTTMLGSHSFVLTPHFVTPIYDEWFLREQLVLNTGTFNLGFFAVRKDAIGQSLVDWWRRKLFDECLMDQSRGYFVDQKWMNLSICHFDNYCIDKHPGLNMAHWNMHERTLSSGGPGRYIVNRQVPLVFFHFSTFKPEEPTLLARGQNRYTFETRPDVAPLFEDYAGELEQQGYTDVRRLRPVYGRPMPSRHRSVKDRVKSKLIRGIQRW